MLAAVFTCTVVGFQVPHTLPLAPLVTPRVGMGRQHLTMVVKEKTERKSQSFGAWVKATNEANKQKKIKVGERPKVGKKRLPPEALEVVRTKFKKEYPMAEIEQVWGALLACYGNEKDAIQACRDNYQILSPSYSFCNTLLASRDALVDMMGKEEALEVMKMNPAVLQCGPSLDTLGPDEIKGFANLRAIGKKIPDNIVGPACFFVLGLVCYPILAVRVPALADSDLTNIVKPLVGILFAVLIEGSRIAIVGTIVKAKMAGDESVDRAKANEQRRMGMTK